MKDLKESHHSSIFPVKLTMAYVVSVSLFHLSFVIQISDPDYIGRFVDVWNGILGRSLLLSIPLLGVILSAIWLFRKMPIFAVVMILLALSSIGTASWLYFTIGFDPRFDLDLQPHYFLRGALIFAVPFILTYFAWRFRPRKQAGGLPEPET